MVSKNNLLFLIYLGLRRQIWRKLVRVVRGVDDTLWHGVDGRWYRATMRPNEPWLQTPKLQRPGAHAMHDNPTAAFEWYLPASQAVQSPA